MKREVSGQGPSLTAIFVDYDNIYLSLRRKNEDAAKRFAKDAALWLKAIELGTIITPTNAGSLDSQRRVVMNRCYGNPVPRRNQGDNSTDMTSFPFVRHHFLRAGFEIVDCPPLTQQLKNSSDIRMVMDVRDYLHHDTYFDEFIILSGDADFTPVLHRLRAHARRTVIFANDYTAAPYTAISDGEIREADLIRLLLNGVTAAEGDGKSASQRPATEARKPAPAVVQAPAPRTLAPVAQAASLSAPTTPAPVAIPAQPQAPAPQYDAIAPRPAPTRTEDHRDVILATIIDAVRTANGPVPIEMLADRAVRLLGQDKTAGTNWAGAGSFRGFLLQNLPSEIRMTEQSPYYAYDVERHGTPDDETELVPTPPDLPPVNSGRGSHQQVALPDIGAYTDTRTEPRVARAESLRQVTAQAPAPIQSDMAVGQPPRTDNGIAAAIQQAVARIFEACQAPPLGPLEYRMLFELMATELNENKLSGAQTITNVLQRAAEQKLRVTRDDIRFVFDVVSEVDPWFEQGASASLFAGRFRNFVVARCRTQGLSLSADDIDLIDRLFTGGSMAIQQRQSAPVARPAPQIQETGWGGDTRRPQAGQIEPAFGEATSTDDFPRIVRSRMRG
jgi:NYN domain